jgi:predicted PurR-regulated permease PerM
MSATTPEETGAAAQPAAGKAADSPEPRAKPAQAAATLAASAAEAAHAAVAEASVAADAAEDVAEVPTALPFRPRTRTLVTVLVMLLVLYTCFLARELIVPIVLAMFLGLCGNPIVARLNRLWVPRWLGALVVVIGGLVGAVYAGSLLLPPAAEWMRAAPSELRQHIPRLRELAKPFEEANRATESLQKMAEMGPQTAVAPPAVNVMETPRRGTMVTMLSEAPRQVGSILAVMILSFFFMVYGEDLLRRFITVVPGWRQKRITVDILRSIQSDISRYMLTITVINCVLGALTAGALMWIGLSPYDSALWGVVAGVMNFAPYIGPLVAALAFTLVGLVEFDTLGQALLVPGAFLVLHLIEGQLVTPVILGRRMAISPVILMLWLFLWGWMWGIAGLLLAVPMLVCFKIYCSRVEGMKSWAMMMEP